MNKKTNKKTKILTCVLTGILATFLSISIPVILFKCNSNINLNDNNDSNDNNDDSILPSPKPDVPEITDELFPEAPWNGQLFSLDDLYKIPDVINTEEEFQTADVYLEKIIDNNIDRNINNNIYETALLKEWKDNNIFSTRDNNGYPGYDFNWKIIKDYGNQYNQDMIKKYYKALVNEYAESNYWSGKNVKWKDANFIRNEIKNNNLKKHPAALNLHDPNYFIKDSTKAISKEFIYIGNRKGLYSTGMYAPAGEIITLELTPEQFNIWKSNDFKGINLWINHGSFDEPRDYGDTGMVADRYPYTQVQFDFENLKYGDPTNVITETSDWIYENGMYKYQFGSPFGGSISVQYETSLTNNGSVIPLEFKISGGIEEVHYIHGVTTLDDWNNQISKVLSGAITSPNIAIDSYWFNGVCSMYNKYQFSLSDAGSPPRFPSTPLNHNPSTSDIAIGGYGMWYSLKSVKSISELNYPYNMVKKWDNFLMLSNFFIRADDTNSPYKEEFRFGPEVWGGAVGWGGSYRFWTYPDAFTQMFFSGEDVMCATGNWLAMHEINHGYEPPNWNFDNLPHGVTNQLTALNLTVVGDVPRYRNIFNINAEWNYDWSRLITPFGNVSSDILDAYTIFCDYLYMTGTGKTFEYARWQQSNAGKNGYPKKGGFNEIYVMSRFSGQNFYYAFRDLYAGQKFLPISKDGSDLTSEQKKMLNELNKLPSIDILGNLYASGTYIYDYLIDDYVYTNDVVPPFEIPAGIDSYTFDFQNGIKSRNPDFNFEIKSFDKFTKLGGRLEVDPNNSKNLIYYPPKFSNINDFANIDEFDLEIQATHSNKYENYVPGYKFKIKIRQNAKSANINLNNVNYSAEKSKYVEAADNQILTAKFLAPETGVYSFNFKNNKKLIIKKDGSLISNTNISLNKGEFIDIEYNFNKNERTFDIECNSNGNVTDIDFFSNIYSPFISSKLLTSDISNNSNLVYKPRFASTNGIGYWAKNYVQQPYEDNAWKSIDPRKFNITYTHNGSKPLDANKIKYKDNSAFRIGHANTIPTLEFQYTFNEPISLSSLVVYSGASGFYMWKPKGLNVICHTSSGETINVTNNEFSQFANWSSVPYATDYKYLNFEQTVNDVTSMEIIIEKETGQHCLDIEWINLLSNKIDSQIANCITSNSSFIKYSSDWETISNSFDTDKNLSTLNNESKYTRKLGNYLEFNIYGNGFSLIGKKPNEETLIDVYIDNELVSENFDISGDNISFNQTLYCWFDDNSKNRNINVKIVLKSNKPLYINGIGISSLINTIGRIIK